MDKYDINFLRDNIIEKMPARTETISKVKGTFDMGLPKNLQKYTEKVNDKFLNQHLAEIEEANKMNFLTKNFNVWFYKQQSYRNESKNHDGFFTKLKNYVELDMKNNVLACGFIMNPSRFAGVVNGPDLEVGGTGINDIGWAVQIWAQGVTANVTDLYDRIAVNISSAVGNERLGVYDDTGSTAPDNLLAETGSIASSNGFNLRSLTEFSIITAQTWIAIQVSSTTNDIFYENSGTPQKFKSQSFGAFEDPMTSPSNGIDLILNCKIGHS